MTTSNLTKRQVLTIQAALEYICAEIEDDLVFEDRFGCPRWVVEELLAKMITQDSRIPGR